MKGGWVYIMANRPFGTLYIGVTNDIARRAWEHRQCVGPGYTAQYKIVRLVYYEPFDNIVTAIRRETRLKHWSRAWKLDLIERQNPRWDDLFDQIVL
ncbi:MAG: GIY-YIG nuclease family protein [Acetobacteraceae bacterium]|nr:GIY-YIG nuclease family protein [Acetobacteraceae bacterium]